MSESTAPHAAVKQGELEAALVAAPIGFASLVGPDMIFQVANHGYLRMVSRTDVVGKKWVDVFPELVGTPTEATVRGVYEGKVVRVQEYSVPIVGPDGVLRDDYFSFSLEPTRGPNGEVTGFVVIVIDVTELVRRRKEAEALAASLQHSEARFSSVLRTIDDGFCIFEMLYDANGKPIDYRFLQVNAAFADQTGIEDAVGKTMLELAPDMDGLWFERYGHVAATGEPARFENHAPAMNRWFNVFASRVGDPSLRQVAVIFKDTTARKQADAAQEALLAAESRARRDAERTNRIKDDFLATVSHELRTPLNAILGWATLLRGGTLDDAGRDRAAVTIERNARVQTRLIEDLLDMSRVLQGKFTLSVGPVELVHVVNAALDAVRSSADAKGVRLQPILDSHATIVGDPERIQQIAWNLFANAIKFTPKGGRVQITLQKAPSYVELTVADTGQGITEDFLPHVFEPFRQADGGITRRSGGLGLGLSIVSSLVEMHGGTITAASEGVGLGAKFTVRLPMAPVRSDAPTHTAPKDLDPLSPKTFEAPPELSGLRVLVVDDEQDTRNLITFLLEQCSANVTQAPDARTAFEKIQSGAFDVVVSDVGMPEEDGISLVKRIRQLPADRGGQTPAVALTAYARSEDRTNVLRAGFDVHLAKPIEAPELLLVIAALVRNKRG